MARGSAGHIEMRTDETSHLEPFDVDEVGRLTAGDALDHHLAAARQSEVRGDIR